MRRPVNRNAPGAAALALKGDSIMYGWAITFAVLALIAAILGFGGIAGTLADIAFVIFVIALALTLLFLVLGWKAAKRVVG